MALLRAIPTNADGTDGEAPVPFKVTEKGLPLDGPYRSAVAITPDDTGLNQFRAIHVGTNGDVAVLLVDDEEAVILKAVPAGTLLRLWTKKVLSTGTSATQLVGLN